MTTYNDLQNKLKAKPCTWLVTGVAGFIGSNLLETLLKLNQKVIGLDDFFSGYEHNLVEVQKEVNATQWQNFTFIKGSVCEADLCLKVTEGVDYILHQAALGSVPRSIEDPQLNNEINVKGTLNIFEAARVRNVKRVVYASSSAIYGDAPEQPKKETQTPQPMSPYAVSKMVDELYASVFTQNYNLQLIGLRYFNVFGKRQDPKGAYAAVIPTWIDALIKNKGVHINGDGSVTRDFCHVANVVQANLLAATTDNKAAVNQVYNVAIGSSVSLNELIQTLLAQLQPRFAHLKDFKVEYRDFRVGDILHSSADISKIKALLGYESTHDMQKGVAEALEWYIAQSS